MDREKALEFILERLKEYGANVYEYNGIRFVAIKNPHLKSNMVITFGEENMTMEFATQAARFGYGDEEDLVNHAERYLKGELCAVEFFFGGQPLFGGSRDVTGMSFKTNMDVAKWYGSGNETATENINKMLTERQVIVVCSLWTSTPDRIAMSTPDGVMTDLSQADG